MKTVITMHFSIKCVVVLLTQFVSVLRGELFTSNAHLQTALYAEKDIASLLNSYVEQEQMRLDKIKKLADDYDTHSNTALENIDSYLGNPVNAFLLIKRFTLDWDRDVLPVVSNNSWDSMFREIEQARTDLPSYEDLKGAASALMRLQDTYLLDTSKVAHGNLGGVKSPELTAEDCFELGRICYNEGDFYHTKLWMQQALVEREVQDEKMKQEEEAEAEEEDLVPGGKIMGEEEDMEDMEDDNSLKKKRGRAEMIDFLAFAHYKSSWMCLLSECPPAECFLLGRLSYVDQDFYHSSLWMQAALEKEGEEKLKTVKRMDALDYLSYSKGVLGDVTQALELTNELLKIDPNHERAVNNKRYFEVMLRDPKRKVPDQERPGYQLNRDEYRNSKEFLTYEALCRDEITTRPKHRLTCQYRTINHPILLLQPAKEETVHFDPWVVVYHDVVSDQEIRQIKQLATPRLNRATVQNAKTGALETASYRISKSAWLKGEDHPVVEKLNQRMQAITGLDMDTAEELQIANYGLGGHYEPHFDFARKEEKDAFKSLGTGNRIATFLNYMSDVEAGGATVFPYIGLKLFPKKGNAAFWYNLYKNGDGIYNTRHAACPVLVGTKWVANKWIHERGQEFRRPCATGEDE
ncbi:prolyl 4-hydroxylase subunit alpha-1 [Aplysia californica]|uniref:procollagen-proline 4-dioxygenase n=1 Tax=Aplysia californica TaxID=6500 RepID=A0ABM1A1M6_APLCA|nr:prolyl 4-hydroxylase subunit alpha-1 [Aplysia californica]